MVILSVMSVEMTVKTSQMSDSPCGKKLFQNPKTPRLPGQVT